MGAAMLPTPAARAWLARRLEKELGADAKVEPAIDACLAALHGADAAPDRGAIRTALSAQLPDAAAVADDFCAFFESEVAAGRPASAASTGDGVAGELPGMPNGSAAKDAVSPSARVAGETSANGVAGHRRADGTPLKGATDVEDVGMPGEGGKNAKARKECDDDGTKAEMSRADHSDDDADTDANTDASNPAAKQVDGGNDGNKGTLSVDSKENENADAREKSIIDSKQADGPRPASSSKSKGKLHADVEPSFEHHVEDDIAPKLKNPDDMGTDNDADKDAGTNAVAPEELPSETREDVKANLKCARDPDTAEKEATAGTRKAPDDDDQVDHSSRGKHNGGRPEEDLVEAENRSHRRGRSDSEGDDESRERRRRRRRRRRYSDDEEEREYRRRKRRRRQRSYSRSVSPQRSPSEERERERRREERRARRRERELQREADRERRRGRKRRLEADDSHEVDKPERIDDEGVDPRRNRSKPKYEREYDDSEYRRSRRKRSRRHRYDREDDELNSAGDFEGDRRHEDRRHRRERHYRYDRDDKEHRRDGYYRKNREDEGRHLRDTLGPPEKQVTDDRSMPHADDRRLRSEKDEPRGSRRIDYSPHRRPRDDSADNRRQVRATPHHDDLEGRFSRGRQWGQRRVDVIPSEYENKARSAREQQRGNHNLKKSAEHPTQRRNEDRRLPSLANRGNRGGRRVDDPVSQSTPWEGNMAAQRGSGQDKTSVKTRVQAKMNALKLDRLRSKALASMKKNASAKEEDNKTIWNPKN